MATRGKFMGVLDDVPSGSGSDSDSSGSGGEEGGGEGGEGSAGRKALGPALPPAKKAKHQELTIEDLERAGYKSGPSVLLVKPPKEDADNDWTWGDGKDQKGKEDEEETREEREANRRAATTGAEEAARYAQLAAQQADRLRQERQAEKEQLAKERRLTVNQKEKRKRDAGQQSRGKNYVEEEKRLARNLGVYSGFDK